MGKLRDRVKRDEIDGGEREGPAAEENEGSRGRGVKALRQEKEILRKARNALPSPLSSERGRGDAVSEYPEAFHDRRRSRSSLGYVGPGRFEESGTKEAAVA